MPRDLSGLVDVSASAGGKIEIVNVDQAQLIPFRGRKFAQAEALRFVASYKANIDRTIFENDFVR